MPGLGSMEHSIGFYQAILDSLSEHIVAIDARGKINYVNAAWIEFATDNHCSYTENWQTINYLSVCDASAAAGESYAAQAAAKLRALIEGTADAFHLEYPCHSPTEERWFSMTGTPLRWSDEFFVIISHQDITRRKLAEQRLGVSVQPVVTGL